MDAYLQQDTNLDKVGGALEKHFQSKRLRAQQDAQKKEIEQLEEQFKNPVDIDVSGSPFKGPEDAKVTVVEFSDFQCPYCSRGMETMYQVAAAYPKDVKIVFKHLPLGFHKEAKPAARASMAAHEQGKFWEMHDALFKNQKGLSDAKYHEIAKSIGLDVEKFKADYASGKYDAQIDKDVKIANDNGIRGTPGFFVNGVQVRGARPLPYFKNLVDRWLKEGGAAPKADQNAKADVAKPAMAVAKEAGAGAAKAMDAAKGAVADVAKPAVDAAKGAVADAVKPAMDAAKGAAAQAVEKAGAAVVKPAG